MLHCLVALAVCLGSLSCWKTQPRPIFNALTEGQNLTIHGPIHPPLNTVQSSCPLWRKAPPKHDVSTPMLHGWDDVLGIVLILLPPNTARGVYTKKLYFGLMTTWPSPMPPLDHPDGLWQTSDGPGHVLAWAGGPCARSRVLIPCSSRLILHLSQDHWYSTRRDLAWSPSPREIDSHLEFLPFSNNCTNSCCLSPSCLPIVL